MKPMSRWLTLVLLFSCAVLFCGCSCTPVSLTARYVHVSLLKGRGEVTPKFLERVLKDIEQLLTPIPSLRGMWAGRPVPQGTLPGVIVDGDYDLGVLLVFDSKKGLDDFRQDPGYIEFRKRYETSLEIRTIDFSPYGGTPKS